MGSMVNLDQPRNSIHVQLYSCIIDMSTPYPHIVKYKHKLCCNVYDY